MRTYREFISESVIILERGETQVPRKPGESKLDHAQRVRAAREARRASTGQDASARSREGMKYTDPSGRSVDNSGQGSFNKQGQTRTPPSGGGTKPPRKPGFKMPNVKVPQGAKQAAGVAGRAAGPALTAVDAALTYKGRRGAGESRKRAAAGTATQIGGALAGAKAGATGGAALGGLVGGPIGAGIGGVVGGIGGYAVGSEVGKKAFNVAAGATPQQKKQMQVTNRQRQSGGALVGTGGKTTFDTKKNTMTTGDKTVQLAKTSVVKDPTTGKLATGHLAYKDGKAVYKRAADPSTLAKTSTNPLERIGRTLNPGAYAKSDAAAKSKDFQKAAASDIKRQQALGVKGSQNLVGPKIVGPKIVGSGGGNPGRRGQGSRK